MQRFLVSTTHLIQVRSNTRLYAFKTTDAINRVVAVVIWSLYFCSARWSFSANCLRSRSNSSFTRTLCASDSLLRAPELASALRATSHEIRHALNPRQSIRCSHLSTEWRMVRNSDEGSRRRGVNSALKGDIFWSFCDCECRASAYWVSASVPEERRQCHRAMESCVSRNAWCDPPWPPNMGCVV